MMLFRRARDTDLHNIHQLAEKSGVGMTTLSKNLSVLKKRLVLSTASFDKKVSAPKNEYYFFILEDTSSGQLVGTSAIIAVNGHDAPIYSYKVTQHVNECPTLNKHITFETLSMAHDIQGFSEICTLFLDPSYRQGHNGMLLSRARFLFMAEHPNRFTKQIIAEMRGVADDAGNSPFWNAVGRPFFNMSFAEADHLSSLEDKQFIEQLMPKYPIYVPLLTPEAQAVIGRPHPLTVPAMRILSREGFHYNHYVDIFDAGPTVIASREGIRTITTSNRFVVQSITHEVENERWIMANPLQDFRATVGHAHITKQHVVISKIAAEVLQLTCGDVVRMAPL